jgi:hypothetical protein
MRRLLVVLFVLAAAGCSTDSEPPASTPTPAGAPSAAPAPASGAAGRSDTTGTSADKALTGDTKAICEQANRVSAQFAATFAQDIKLLIDASSESDPAAADQAKQKTSRDVQNYAFALSDMAKLADDAEVKQALGEMSRQVGSLRGDVRKLDDKKLASINGALDEACGTT